VRKNRLHPYPASVLATAHHRKLFGPEDRVLVALSAGPDSTALLAALVALRDAGELTEVYAVHVDHGLRAGAEEDAACAAAACARLRVPLQRVKVRVAPGNVQAEARRARYAALRESADRAGATKIATGHTRSDQAETVLLRLLRGAGALGLSGIPPRRGRIVRPLIDRSRGEGLAYLAELGIAWRDDPTNATPRFARNRLRLELVPLLRQLAPQLERRLARVADLSRADERTLARLARTLLGEGAGVDLAALRSAPIAIRRRAVRELFRRKAGRGAALGSHHVDAAIALLRRKGPGRIALPGGLEARCRYGRLEIGKPAAAPPTIESIQLQGPGLYPVPARGLSVEVEGTPGCASFPLVLRTRRTGDRFRPAGGTGSKSLKRWLIDRKVPREDRGALLVVAAGSRVLALPELGAVAEGVGQDFRVRIRRGA
jgi:tRNA(Ile)-lysidine synthase